MYKQKGKIIAISEVITGTTKAGKEWSKVQFVIVTPEEKYPKEIEFGLLKLEELEGHEIGSNLEVTFTAESRLSNGRRFTNLTATNLSRPATDLPF
jgi:hypothetical protein